MPTIARILLAIPFFLVALLYSSVGHAGASAYLGVMALSGAPPSITKPTALALNIVVASIASVKFYRARCFSWPLFWPFAATSIPLAFLGGAITLPGSVYKVAVGLVLMLSAIRLVLPSNRPGLRSPSRPRLWLALLIGAGIGFLSGLIGVGGGIFLSPLLVLAGWSDARTASGVAAPFILANSIAGLLGAPSSLASIPSGLPVWVAAVVVGGWMGADWGSKRLRNDWIRRLLAVVLIAAGLKLVLV